MRIDKLKRGRQRTVMCPENDEKKMLKELKKAVDDLSDFLTDFLRDQTQYGCYSTAALGEEAVTYFTQRAVVTFFEGTWERYEGETIRAYLGRIVFGDMGHAYDRWKDKLQEAQFWSMDENEKQQHASMERANQELMETMARLALASKIAHEVATERVKDDPELLRYLKLMEEQDSYRYISKKMRINMPDVKALEARLLDRLVGVNQDEINAAHARIAVMAM